MTATRTRRQTQGTRNVDLGYYGRRRGAVLLFVYVLIALHIAHWKISGKTLAPLELNEVMYTLEFGVVTAGFLFMAGITLATAFFGRVFCSWGCHMLALQDSCAWILRKLHIKPKVMRSRLLAWVPLVAALYMFAWPQIVRLSQGKPIPQLHMRTDAEGWASFATENFWRNLPEPAITLLTFAVCGFLIVYVLGSRGFCAYGCPYGAIFRVADRLAPMRIRLKDDADCLACGTCTAVCKSHVRVHEELNRFGTVVNAACLRDFDCVAACPKGNVYYGVGLPTAMSKPRSSVPVRKEFDFSLGEEAILGFVFVFALFTYRGLYEKIPFLLSLGLAAILAYCLVLFIRLCRRRDVQFNRWQLKLHGKLSPIGILYASSIVAVVLFTIHSTFVHYHSAAGNRLAANALKGTFEPHIAERALHHLDLASRFGILPTTLIPLRQSDLHYQLAGSSFRTNNTKGAEQHLRAALRSNDQNFMAHYDLGALLLRTERRKAAEAHLRRAIELKPDFGDGHYNLAVVLWMSGARDAALHEIDEARRLNPDDPQSKQLAEVMRNAFESNNGE